MGNWKAILNDPSLHFDNRSPVDLKDRSVSLTRALEIRSPPHPDPPASALTSPTHISNIIQTPRPIFLPRSALPCQMVPPSLRRRAARSVALSLRRRIAPSKPVMISTAPFGPPLSKTQSFRSRTAVPPIYATGSATLSQISTRRQDTSHATLQRKSSLLPRVPSPTSTFMHHVKLVLPAASDVTPPRVFYEEERRVFR